VDERALLADGETARHSKYERMLLTAITRKVNATF